jgi:G3E family GTPase
MTPARATAVTVLTGFLGAGKTTLLNRLIRHPSLVDTAVIINEFGEIGIDHLLVERADEGVVLLSSGCLCCTIRGELADTLADLAARREAGAVPAFRRVVIETTGLADPAPILQTLMSHPALAPLYRLAGVVTLVDAVNGAATLDAHFESVKQVAVADRIVLSKADLAADRPALERLGGRLRALNPAAPIIPAADADPGELLAPGLFDRRSSSSDVERWLQADAYGDPHRHHDVNRHGAGIQAFSLTTQKAISPARLDAFLDLVRTLHGEALLRLKAIVKLTDDPSRPVVLHGVQHVLHAVARLPAWPGADTRSRLVFIVRDLDPALIDRLFASFTDEPRIDRPDAAALADNPLSLRGG